MKFRCESPQTDPQWIAQLDQIRMSERDLQHARMIARRAHDLVSLAFDALTALRRLLGSLTRLPKPTPRSTEPQ